MYFISKVKPTPRLISFFILYLLITKETIEKLIFLSVIILISCLIIKFFYESKRKTIILTFFSLIIFLPLGFPSEIQNIFLPSGYKYISISIISSLIFYLFNEEYCKSNIKNIMVNFTTALFAPSTYISGPSATAKEIIKKDEGNSIKIDYAKSLKLIINGCFGISLGYLITNQNFDLSYFLNNSNNIYATALKIFCYGFINFWNYYLLFSGASEICKGVLALLGIDIINNFSNPEQSIYYHEIWSRWHLNITDRVRKYLYTPITLFVLRRSSKLNKFLGFIYIEGLPICVLFLILAIWHGSRPRDYVFAFSSIFFTLLSTVIIRYSKINDFIKNFNYLKEFIRIISITIFGLTLGIYSFGNTVSQVIVNQNHQQLNLYFFYVFSIFINIFYRYKFNIYKSATTKQKHLKSKLIVLFQLISILFIYIFLGKDNTLPSNFIYFS